MCWIINLTAIKNRQPSLPTMPRKHWQNIVISIDKFSSLQRSLTASMPFYTKSAVTLPVFVYFPHSIHSLSARRCLAGLCVLTALLYCFCSSTHFFDSAKEVVPMVSSIINDMIFITPPKPI
jgi:hypothetical protein